MNLFRRQDWAVAAVLLAVSLALRVPCRMAIAYWWDCAQAGLAVELYDLSISQPHVPGYFLYVMAGRAVNALTGDPLGAMIWLSVLAGAGLAVVGYLLGTAMFGRGCGTVAGAILATSPLCWFHSCVALMYVVDSLLVAATVLVCWWAMQRDRGWRSVVALAVMLATVAGVRQQTAPLLVPLWLYAFCKLESPRWPKFFAGVGLTGALCLLWFVPMMLATGGVGRYLELFAGHGRVFGGVTPWDGGIKFLWNNIEFIASSCWVGLLAAAVFAVGAGIWLLRQTAEAERRQWYAAHREQFRVLALWVLPMLCFWIGLYATWPGYVLGFFPALAILAGLLISRAAERLTEGAGSPVGKFIWRVMPISLIVATNAAAFLCAPPSGGGWQLGFRLTLRELRDHERQMDGWFKAIRARFRPEEALICHAYQHDLRWSFRHFQYHLPAYESVLLTPDRTLEAPLDRQLMCAQDRRLTFRERFDPGNKKILVLIVPPGYGVDLFRRDFDVTQAVAWAIDGSPWLYTVTVDAALSGRRAP